MKTKEQVTEFVKDVISHAKINQDVWLEQGNNKEFRPSFSIFENGFIVSMYHTAASPKHQSIQTILIKDCPKKEDGTPILGLELYVEISDTMIYEDTDINCWAENIISRLKEYKVNLKPIGLILHNTDTILKSDMDDKHKISMIVHELTDGNEENYNAVWKIIYDKLDFNS